MQKANTANIPTILAILGATGDLTAKKIVPSLHHIFRHRHLPTMFRVVGFSRQNLSDESFRGRVREAVERHHAGTGRTPPKLDEFLGLFSYTQGDFTNVRGFGDLKGALDAVDREWGVCTNKLFYLAAPPQFYEAIFKNLAASRLTEPCSPEEGWTRVIVEKPFGKDLKTAEALDGLLGKLFREVQIYRIDHYLGKEMVQNMITFRFANNLFERDWGKDLIERIDVRILEKIGVEERGDFYDGVGALRDVGQNHLLQMLALVTMAHPVDFRSDAIRARREEILKSLRVFSKEETQVRTFRGQYEGYRAAEGVSPQSTTETYFKIRAELETPRWQGVPVILEGGKCMDQDAKEVVVTFRHPAPCLCPPDAKEHLKNRLVIHLSGREGITVQFWSKKPGITMDLEERSLDFFFKGADEDRPYAEAYEKLLVDCIRGDQTLFVSGGEVSAMWKFIDPIV
ncbi:MAG: glucose-6-phosphate dehydrogenase, partial [Candidatus Liptonbacteria bacterium]|nr:glucose-6-phosphate dehydrogenase [Candidatus Liptonbacteria bacterium]